MCDTPSRQDWSMAVGAQDYRAEGRIPGPVGFDVKKIEIHVKTGKI